MKLKRLVVYALMIVSFAFSITAKDLTGVKIYINPGHGGYSNGGESDDRFIPTIPFPNESEMGFWESKCNLVKGLELQRLLKTAGATVMISRTTNEESDDRDLTEIVNEANNFKANAYISIHSNQLGANAGTNYFLNLYNADYNDMKEPFGYGYIGKSEALINKCIEMATQSAEYFKGNNLTVWNTYDSFQVKEDYAVCGYTLGALRRLEIPGFLIESSFHDYEPETHRLLNDDYAKLTSWNLYRFYCDYFEADKPTVGVIAGSVKDGAEEMTHQYYNNWKSGTHDRLQPINGATITLKNNAGAVVKTYITDQYYNGVFVFFDLAPGTYTVVMEADGYDTKTQEVTVTAAETTSFVQLMNKEARPNIMATALTGELDGAIYNISFMLNATPTSVAINIYSEDDVLLNTINPIGDFKKGLNRVSIDLKDLSYLSGNSFKWSVVATAEGYDTWRCISAIKDGEKSVPEDQLMGYPSGIAVDKNPSSPYYGNIYVLNTQNTSYAANKELGTGVYIYNSLLECQNPDDGKTPYTGNVSWTSDVAASEHGQMPNISISPAAITVDDDGYVYISDMSETNGGVYRMDPANPENDFVKILTVTTDNHYGVCGIAVTGTGADKVLYTINMSQNVSVNSLSGYLYKYNMNTLLNNVNYKGEKVLAIADHTMGGKRNTYLAPDRRGGVWVTQRWDDLSKEVVTGKGHFTLVHVNKNGVVSSFNGKNYWDDWFAKNTQKTASRRAMGIDTNIDGSKVVVGVYGAIGIENITYDNNGNVVTFANSDNYIKGYDNGTSNPVSNINHMVMGVAFDAADNVYVADWSDYFQAYALGKSNNTHETMARQTIDMTVVGVEDVCDDYVTVIKNGEELIVSSQSALGVVQVFNLYGVNVYETKTANCNLNINLCSWMNGLYVVKVGDKIIKVIK